MVDVHVHEHENIRGHMDTRTWIHGHMDTETWRHMGMEIWTCDLDGGDINMGMTRLVTLSLETVT
jgi:hypothetical protein